MSADNACYSFSMESGAAIIRQVGQRLEFPNGKSILVRQHSCLSVGKTKLVVNGIVVFDADNAVEVNEALQRLVDANETINPNISVGCGIGKVTTEKGSVTTFTF